MPRKPQPWFRFYTEAVYDPKLRGLPSAQRWVWVAILAAARRSHVPGLLLVSDTRPMDDRRLADDAAVPLRDVRKALVAMEADGMIHRDEATGAWAVTKWKERQFESDDVTERTRKYRSKERDRNVPMSFVGTAPENREQRTEPLTPSSDSRGHPPNVNGQGLVEQAIAMAARRYGEQGVQAGNGRSVDGLAKWWLQENAEGARARAANLLADYDLGATTLADALLQPNPSWLRNYRRRATT